MFKKHISQVQALMFLINLDTFQILGESFLIVS